MLNINCYLSQNMTIGTVKLIVLNTYQKSKSKLLTDHSFQTILNNNYCTKNTKSNLRLIIDKFAINYQFYQS